MARPGPIHQQFRRRLWLVPGRRFCHGYCAIALLGAASLAEAGVGDNRADTRGGGGGIDADVIAMAAHAGPGQAEFARRARAAAGSVDADHDDSYVYALPYAVGENFAVLQGYGSRFSHRGAEHNTVDFGMPEGTPVYSARDGRVVAVEQRYGASCPNAGCDELANFVVILHADGTTGQYFHLQQNSVSVRVGETVVRGELIALSGNTGYSTTPHLHFGVYRRDRSGALQSIPVRFAVRGGEINAPRTGARYTSVVEHSLPSMH